MVQFAEDRSCVTQFELVSYFKKAKKRRATINKPLSGISSQQITDLARRNIG